MIGQTFSHYRIIKELGKGGMGVVYLAEDTVLGRQVAIKTLIQMGGPGRKHYHTRFLREAQAVSALSHPHIAHIYDYGETNEGQPYIVMELIKGGTLADLMLSDKLTISRTVEIIQEVAEALAEAHRHGIIHRDIKPSNVGINERGEVKVLDFGLAKQLTAFVDSNQAGQQFDQQVQIQLTQTSEGVRLGTPMYLSPEQAIGIPVDARSDLFSLGSVLYECIAGTPAFAGRSEIDICAKVIRDDPPPPSKTNSGVTAELDQLTLRVLAKKPEDRYQSADELMIDLLAIKTSLENHHGTLGISTIEQKLASTSLLHKRETRGSSNISAMYARHRLLIGSLAFLSIASLAYFFLRYKPTLHEPPAEAKRWYDQGTTALQDGTYYKASKMFEEATKQDNNYALAHARLAEAWNELGYVDKATTEISKANLQVDRSALPRIDEVYLQAINATISRDFKGSVESYRQMLASAQDSDKPHVYVDLGRAYEKNEELQNAISSYQQATKEDSQYSSAFLRLGSLYVRQQDFPNAEAAFNKAFNLYEIQTNPEGLAEVLYQRGVLFNSIGDTAKAREALERALEVVRAFSSTAQQVKTMLQLSSVYRLMGDTELAKRYTTDAIDLARSSGLSDLTTEGLIQLGNVFFFRSEISEAEKNFRQALELARRDNNRVNEARALFSLGSLYIQQDNPEEGIPYLTQGLPFFQHNGYRKEVMQSQTLLGQAYDMKGNYDAALKAFGEQLQLATDLGNQLQIALSHKGIGTVLAHQEKYTEALDHFNQSYSIYSAAGNKLYAGYNLISRADVLWRLGRYQEAKAALSQASSLAEQPDGKFKQLWGRLYVVTAPMALSEQLYSKAIEEARKAIALDNSETKHPAIEAKYTLGLAQSLSGLNGQGRKTCEEAVEMARRANDPRLLAGAQLALAEVMLLSGDPSRALAMAKSAQQILEPSGQLESEWRAWLMAGHASQLLGDQKAARESLLRADSQLSSLQQRWGTESFMSYVNRPDIKVYRAQLRKVSAAVQ